MTYLTIQTVIIYVKPLGFFVVAISRHIKFSESIKFKGTRPPPWVLLSVLQRRITKKKKKNNTSFRIGKITRKTVHGLS